MPRREKEAGLTHHNTRGFIQCNNDPTQCHVFRTTGTVGHGHSKQLFPKRTQLVERLLRKDQTLLFYDKPLHYYVHVMFDSKGRATAKPF
jgi:hypothetical protein